jgi:antitoxin component YwqK of YwqJK toxin-antitoxin module
MLIPRLWPRPLRYLGLLLVLLTLLPWACTRKTVSFNSNPEVPTAAVLVPDTLVKTADSLKGKPSLSTARKVVLTKEEERAAKEKEKEAQRKPNKKKKIFLGERIKRGFVKTGPSGRNQIIEVFYYLKYFQQPNPYAPARYYFNPKKRKLFKATAELDPAVDKVLHGPYKKMQNNKVLETGYYALGTRHLRWERFDKNGILLAKTHYEMGFPRDANISYYGNDRSLINEVVPYVNGKLEGDYAKFTIEGQREWSGQFENGRKVGEWTNYWGFRNRKRYVYQYPESGYDPEAEPVLIKEYNRNAILIYDRETNLDKRGLPEDQQAPKGRVVPKAAPKVAPKRKKPSNG